MATRRSRTGKSIAASTPMSSLPLVVSRPMNRAMAFSSSFQTSPYEDHVNRPALSDSRFAPFSDAALGGVEGLVLGCPDAEQMRAECVQHQQSRRAGLAWIGEVFGGAPRPPARCSYGRPSGPGSNGSGSTMGTGEGDQGNPIMSTVSLDQRLRLAQAAYANAIHAVRGKSTPYTWRRLVRAAENLRDAIRVLAASCPAGGRP